MYRILLKEIAKPLLLCHNAYEQRVSTVKKQAGAMPRLAFLNPLFTFSLILDMILAIRQIDGTVKNYAQNCLQAPAE